VLGDIIKGLLNIAREHAITIDSHYLNILINLICLEGMATSINPEYNLLDNAKPLLKLHEYAGD